MNRLHEMWIVLHADRRKAGVLLALALVLAFMVGRQALEAGPREASGAGAREGSENAQGPGPGGRAITLDELRLDGPVIEVAIGKPVRRNVFGFDERYFPDPAQSASSSEVEEKSGPEAVESPREDGRARLEQIERTVREEAGGLRLKSILMGPSPMAVIESGVSGRRTARTLRIGDRVDGFTLVSVEAAGAVLEKHGVRIELER